MSNEVLSVRIAGLLTLVLVIGLALSGCGIKRVPASYVPKRPALTQQEALERLRAAQGVEFFQGEALVKVRSGILEKVFPARLSHRAPDLLRVDSSLGGMMGIFDADIHLFRRGDRADLYIVRDGTISESRLIDDELLGFLGVDELPADVWGLAVGLLEVPDTLSAEHLDVTSDGRDYLASYHWKGWSRIILVNGLTGLPMLVEDKVPDSPLASWSTRFLRNPPYDSEGSLLSVRFEQAEGLAVLQIDYLDTDTSTPLPEEIFSIESLVVACRDSSGEQTEHNDIRSDVQE